MKIAGIDDAGRGSMIGPIAVAGVILTEKEESMLVALGVRDSKLLSRLKREQLSKKIKSLCSVSWHTMMLSPLEIDSVVEAGIKYHNLNRLEAHAMAKVIVALRPDIVYVDASDVSPERFKQYITEKLPFRVQIVSEHKADVKYPVVSTASIIAKVERDREISDLKEKFGDLGSGYPSDSKTIDFLENWIKRKGTLPDFVRKSWAPIKRLKREVEQKS